MADRRVQCVVDEDPNLNVVWEVNAFRIIPDTGKSYFLDFLDYSPAALRAKVLGRIRVPEDALSSFRDRLSNDMLEAPGTGITVAFHIPSWARQVN